MDQIDPTTSGGDDEIDITDNVADPTVQTAPVKQTLADYQTEDMMEMWKEELEVAREDRRKFDEGAVETINRYSDFRKGQDAQLNSNRYNLFYANTDIKHSALYSRTPTADVRRRFLDADDDVSRVAADIIKRAAYNEMDLENFDLTFKQVLFDYLVPGIGVAWVRFEEEYSPAQTTIVIDAQTGQKTQSTQAPQLLEQITPIDYVAWDDFIWSPCQVWSACRWLGRRVPMNKEAFTKRFQATLPPGFDIDSISFEKKEKGNSDFNPADKLRPEKVTEETTYVYEIWDKQRRLVWWLNESATVPLDIEEDKNKIPGFYPTPLPPLGRFTTSSTLPRSDYFLAQDLYKELDTLNARIFDLIDCIQVRFVYDNQFEELKNLFTTIGPNKGIGIKNWGSFQGDKGGLDKSIEFVPTEKYATALQIALQNLAVVKQEIADVEGITDFMRGETQPYDSAAAITQKGNFAPSRLGQRQKMVALYCEQVVRIKVHLMTKFYHPEVLIDKAGALPKTDQQLIGQAVQLLKSNFSSNFKLEVSVDAIQDAQWKINQAERTQIVQMIGQMIGEAMPALEKFPQLAPMVVSLIKFSIAGMKGASEVEGIVDSNLSQLLALAKKPQQPKPDPAQVKAQSEQQKNQTNLQITNEQEQTKRMEIQADAQADATTAALKKIQLQLEALQLKIDGTHSALDGAHKQANDVAQLNPVAHDTSPGPVPAGGGAPVTPVTG